jgi:hypothetical protein
MVRASRTQQGNSFQPVKQQSCPAEELLVDVLWALWGLPYSQPSTFGSMQNLGYQKACQPLCSWQVPAAQLHSRPALGADIQQIEDASLASMRQPWTHLQRMSTTPPAHICCLSGLCSSGTV